MSTIRHSIIKRSSENTRLFNIITLSTLIYTLYVFGARYILRIMNYSSTINFVIAVYSFYALTIILICIYLRRNSRRLWISSYRMRIRSLGKGSVSIIYALLGVLFFGFGFVFLSFIAHSFNYGQFLNNGPRVGLKDIIFPYLFLWATCITTMRLVFKICTAQMARKKLRLHIRHDGG